MSGQFGKLLKHWRDRRRLSQMELSLVADVSTRHVAFLETGRAQPSRSMVMQLAEALQAPFGARNELLRAAGFAPHYRERPLDDQALTAARAAISWTLERHNPYPGFALDRHWRIEMANASAQRMFSFFGLGVGASMLDAFLGAEAFRGALENRREVARHLAARLRSESTHLGGDPVLDAAAEKFAAEAGPLEEEAFAEAASPLMATVANMGGRRLRLFSTIAHFATAEDVALADLKVELIFPADEETRRMFELAADGAVS